MPLQFRRSRSAQHVPFLSEKTSFARLFITASIRRSQRTPFRGDNVTRICPGCEIMEG